MREVWRVLAPSGRLIAVIPNRRGVWTRTDNTPFGHGRPYSRAQITQLLRQTWFTPASWGEALFLPPVGNSWFLRSAMAWERVGAALSLPFAGVHIVEATKQVYRAIPAHRERTRLIPSLEPVLVPSSTASRGIARNLSMGRPRERVRFRGIGKGLDRRLVAEASQSGSIIGWTNFAEEGVAAGLAVEGAARLPSWSARLAGLLQCGD